MDRRFVFWLAPGIGTFTLALAGCQKREEPVPAATPAPAAAPAASAPSDAGAVTQGQPGGNTAPGSTAATGETKKAEKQAPARSHFRLAFSLWEENDGRPLLGLPVVMV